MTTNTLDNSLIGLPWESEGENPIIAPRVGTRSIDCIGLVVDHAWPDAGAQGHHPGGA